MTNTIRLRELICIFPIEISLPDGEYFVFVAIDVKSEFAFEPLIEKGDGIQNLLNYISQLLKDENFRVDYDQPFTLVLHKYQEDIAEVENLVRFHRGSVRVDKELVAKTMAPFIEGFFGANAANQEDFDDLEEDDIGRMDLSFIDFITYSPEQDDKDINEFIQLVKNDKSFIASSDPIELSKYLYKKLEPKLTYAFQKSFLMYGSIVQNNHIPAKYMETPKAMLEAVNHILILQNNDPEYPFADQLNPNRKKQ